MSGTSGQPSPTLRAVGVGLVAVALVLGAVGILTENQDSPSATADQMPTTSATGSAAPSSSATSSSADAPGAAPSSGAASSSAAPSSPTTVTAPAPASPLPTAGSASGGTSGGATSGGGSTGGTGGGSEVDLSVPVRVLNNSTTTGLAADAAARLQQDGFTDVSTGNYPQGVIPTTTVYYRPGTAEEPAAQQIAATLGTRAEARFAGLASASPGVILIVTSDFRG